MSNDSLYTVCGYLDFVGIDQGFVTPIFSRDGSLYLAISSDASIERFSGLPDEYVSSVTSYPFPDGNECKIGGATRYLFKYERKILIGEGFEISESLSFLKEGISDPYAKELIEKFIKKFSGDKPKPISMVVVDELPLVSSAIQGICDTIGNYKVTSDETVFELCIGLGKGERPDMIFLSLPTIMDDGIKALINEIFRYCPNCRIIISTVTEWMLARQLIDMGVKGFLHKYDSTEEFRTCISEVADGNTYVSEAIKTLISDFSLLKSDTQGPTNGS